MPDNKIAESVGYDLPEDSLVLQDLGFLGFEIVDCETLMPFKKPRSRELTPFEKAFNKIVRGRQRLNYPFLPAILDDGRHCEQTSYFLKSPKSFSSLCRACHL